MDKKQLLGIVRHALTFIGGIGVALTTGLKNSGMLLPLLILPFYIPVLIFGASAVTVAADDVLALAVTV